MYECLLNRSDTLLSVAALTSLVLVDRRRCGREASAGRETAVSEERAQKDQHRLATSVYRQIHNVFCDTPYACTVNTTGAPFIYGIQRVLVYVCSVCS